MAHFYLFVESIQCTDGSAFVVPHLRAGFRNKVTRPFCLCEMSSATQYLTVTYETLSRTAGGWLCECAFMHVWNCNEPASFNGAVIRELIHSDTVDSPVRFCSSRDCIRLFYYIDITL